MIKHKRTKAAAVAVSAITAICGILAAACATVPPPQETPEKPVLMREAYAQYFPIGAAVSPRTIEKYADIMPHFSSVTAENDMKWRVVEPAEGQYNYTNGDRIVEWAKEHDTAVRGHCLLWYKSLPVWLSEKFADAPAAEGAELEEYKRQALEAIDKHVREEVEHFGDSIYAWDVANEFLKNTVSLTQLAHDDIWRTGVSGSGVVDWYAICGIDAIEQAFISAAAAREELGLDFKLYYNDYSLNDPVKRLAAVRLVEIFRRDGVPIDGIGMQAHYSLKNYEAGRTAFIEEFEKSVRTFTKLGLDVQITELDIQVSSAEDPHFDGLPEDIELAQGDMFGDIFEVCRRYVDGMKGREGAVTGITTWGVADANNSWNTSNKREYPLIFSAQMTKKAAFDRITRF